MSEPSKTGPIEIGDVETRVREFAPKALALLLALALPFATYAVVGDATNSHVFLVQQVTVGPLSTLSEAEVLQVSQMDRARNVLTIDPYEVEAQLEAHPWIEDATVNVDLRALSVQIDVVERQLAAIVAGAVPLLVDDEGQSIRLWERDELNVPVIVGVGVVRDADGRPHAESRRVREALQVIEMAQSEFPTRTLREVQHRGALGYRLHFENFEITVGADAVSDRLAGVRLAAAELDRRPSYALADSASPNRITFGFTPAPSEER
jgi:hypothetical protein